MKQTGMILASKKKELFKYNTQELKFVWKTEFEKNITGISRIDNFVFVLTSNWGTYSTTLIDYTSGEKKWTIKKILYSIHIIDDTIVYIDKTGATEEIASLYLKTGEEKFRTKLGFWWSKRKTALINKKIYLFSSKKTMVLNQTTGSLTESKLPSNLDSKEITFIIDEFQMNVNTLPSSEAGYFPIIDGGGDMGGGDMGGGDGGAAAGGGE